ncbi:MAG: DUF302 domain-containing protein [Candidatus Thiodiazotropha sp.]
MFSKLFSFLSGMALLVIALCVGAQDATIDSHSAPQSEPMIIEVVSPYDFEHTNRLIQEGVKTEGWKVPKVYDWRAITRSADVDVGPFNMYDLCKAEYAAQILKHDHLRFVSTLMPCATAVYTKSDGKTYIAYMNVKLLAQMFGSELGDVARQAGEARERALSFLNP